MDDQTSTRDQLLAELRALRALVDSRSPGLGESSESFAHVLTSVRAVMVEFDAEGCLTYVSPNSQDVLGQPPEELIGKRPIDVVHPDDRERVLQGFARLMTTGDSSKPVYRARRSEGGWRWLEATGQLGGVPGSPRILAMIQDVTERVEREAALRESEERFRTMAENASDALFEFDEAGTLLFASPLASSLVAEASIDFSQLTIDRAESEYAASTDHSPLERFREILARGEGGGVAHFTTAEGREVWLESKGRTYRRGDGSLRVVVMVRNVSQRMLAEREREESQERSRLITQMSGDLITEFDAEGNVLYVSPTSEKVLGYSMEELRSHGSLDLVHPEDVEVVRKAYEKSIGGDSSSHPPYTYRTRHRDGHWVWFEAMRTSFQSGDGKLHLLEVARDVTEARRQEQERRELEERIQQAQRLEGLGVLAGGIAHDFNNLLTPILGEAGLALMELAPGSSPRARIQKIQKAAQRAATLTNQMLAYAGKGPLLVESLDLTRLVRETSELLESAVAARARIHYDLASDLTAVDGDSAQLTQVVMNLIANAADAVGDAEGEIAIRTGTVEAADLAPAQTIFGNELRDGTYVFFEVSDTGCGMDAETRARIFDPFFTTKFTGRGLGLAAVLGIVRGHRGAIEIESERGLGTRFRVLFPASPRPHQKAPAPMAPLLVHWRARGSVLVIDDDEGVRELMVETLRRTGLEVFVAGDGREGIEIFQRHSDEICLVLLDRTMPSISGEEAFDELRRIRKDACVVLVSGYSEERAAEQFSKGTLAGFLQKPFLPETLLATVQRVIENRS